MVANSSFYLRFWGVRGSIASPGRETVRYGGNTSCIEIRCGDRQLIIDGGTGLRALGYALAAEARREIDLFLTHTHFDHVCGIPFFKPAYTRGTRVNFWAGHLPAGQSIKGVLVDLMMAPLFPVPLKVFQDAAYTDFVCGRPIDLGAGLVMRSFALNHPNNACGYRLDYGGRSICVITDTEHQPGIIDPALVEFVRGAQVMVYDATYTDEEFPRYVTWGHSTWQQALRIADAAGVGRVALFHHDPARTDDQLDAIVAAANRWRPGTVAATEGMVLEP